MREELLFRFREGFRDMRTIIKSVMFRNRSRAVKTVRFRERVRFMKK